MLFAKATPVQIMSIIESEIIWSKNSSIQVKLTIESINFWKFVYYSHSLRGYFRFKNFMKIPKSRKANFEIIWKSGIMGTKVRRQNYNKSNMILTGPSVPQPPQFNTSVPHILCSPQNLSVPHRKPLSSTHSSVPHLKPLSSTHSSDKK